MGLGYQRSRTSLRDEVREIPVKIDEDACRSETFLDVKISVEIDEVEEPIENLFARSRGSDEHDSEITMEAAKFEITIEFGKMGKPSTD